MAGNSDDAALLRTSSYTEAVVSVSAQHSQRPHDQVEWTRSQEAQPLGHAVGDEDDSGKDADADEDKIEARGQISPWDTAGVWSRISYAYVLPLLRLGWKRPIQEADLPPLRDVDRADTGTCAPDMHR